MGDAKLHVVLVGGSGFLGRGLRRRLTSAGHAVTVIGRGPNENYDSWKHVQWDAETLGPWMTVLNEADVLVHLAGKRVDCRPTKANIDELLASRVETVKLVGQAIKTIDTPPSVWVQLSSLAIFGNSGDAIIDESTPIPTDGPRQQVEVCRQWEAAFRDATATGIDRTVLLRPAIGIGGEGDPASATLSRLAKFGLGGTVGSGKQWVSWIGAEDFFNILFRAVTDNNMAGLYHVSSPNPVQNSHLMAAYRKAVGRKFGLPAPALVAKIGAWLLGSDPGLALTGRRCHPTRLIEDGYQFLTTDIDIAVNTAINTAENPN